MQRWRTKPHPKDLLKPTKLWGRLFRRRLLTWCSWRAGPHKLRMLNRIVLSSFVQPMERDRPSVDTPTPDPEATQSIIDHWAPFNQRDSSITHMGDLYPTLLRVLVVDRAEEYTIHFPGSMDRKSFQRVTEDRSIRNHDFNKAIELVWLNFYRFEY